MNQDDSPNQWRGQEREPTETASIKPTAPRAGASPFGIAGVIPTQVLPLCLLLVSIVFTWIFVQYTRLPDEWVSIVFGAMSVCTFLRFRFAVYLFVGWLLLLELGQTRTIKLSFDDVWFAAFGMAYMVLSFRYFDVCSSLGDLVDFRRRVSNSEQNRAHWQTLRPFRAGWHWAGLAILLATIGLLLVRRNPVAVFDYGLTPSGLRALTFLWLLAMAWFTIEMASRLFGVYQRSLEPRDHSVRGQVFARSVFSRELKNELYSIERRRAKKVGKTNRG